MSNSPDQTTRNYDLPEMLVQAQKQGQAAPPSQSPFYAGGNETTIFAADTVSAANWGPPYYCTANSGGGSLVGAFAQGVFSGAFSIGTPTGGPPAPSANQIYCGFWKCC